ncbi:DUF2157 domain-containing protein [Roseateles sp. DAIF2]|nr:DUF2157 domain-containing protein [Roseateles sp. DAIF2]
MDLRYHLFELSARHQLSPAAALRLQQLAGLHEEPPGLRRWLPRLVAVLAAALGGLGLVMWVAANWAELGRFARFGLLQGLILLLCLAAALRPAARAPLALLAFIATGALFAYFGQTYQTGADAWQLFALWAALGLPLALAVRSDLLWAPWALVALLAITLWTQTHTGRSWRVEPGDLRVHLLGFGAMLALGAALAAPLRRFTGAGLWSLRLVALFAVIALSLAAVGGLFHVRIAPQYGLGLLFLALAAAGLATRRGFDVFGLSAVALGLDALLVAGLTRLLFFHGRSGGGDPIGEFLLLSLFAAGLLAGSVTLILKLARRAEVQA